MWSHCNQSLRHGYFLHYHCVKSVHIRSFFWSVFSRIRTKYRSISPYSVRMRGNTDQKKLRIWTLFTQCIIIIIGIYLLKIIVLQQKHYNKEGFCSRSTIKAPKQRHWQRLKMSTAIITISEVVFTTLPTLFMRNFTFSKNFMELLIKIWFTLWHAKRLKTWRFLISSTFTFFSVLSTRP